MNWDDVRVFLAVARARSLARGAREAGLDRSTASRRIGALEEAMGAQVFLRTREGLRLSPTGARLLERAERMAAEARGMTAEAAEAFGEVAGTVRVATTESMGVLFVEAGLLDLRDRYPALVIDLQGGNRPVDVARGEADIAVRLVPVREANVRVRKVAQLTLALFAAEAYVRRRGAPAGEAALAGHDVILPGGELAQLPEARWLESRPDVRVVFRSSSMPVIVAAASAGRGIAALSDPWGQRSPGLRRLFPLDAIAPRPVFLASAPEAASRAAVRVVADRIAEILAQAAPDSSA